MKHFITQRQHEILEGLMLGDGGLSRRKSAHNPVLRIQRSAQDISYNEWLAKEFSNLLTKRSLSTYSVFDERTQKTYCSSMFRSMASDLLLPYYERWYPNGNKCVPQDLILTPLVLAIWFADDGCIQNVDKWSLDMKLSTEGFSYNETVYLVNLLKETLNRDFKIYLNDGKPNIRGFTDASKAFLATIDSVFPPLDRKSNLWRNDDLKLLKGKPAKPMCPKCNIGKVYSYGIKSNGKKNYKCMDCMSCFVI